MIVFIRFDKICHSKKEKTNFRYFFFSIKMNSAQIVKKRPNQAQIQKLLEFMSLNKPIAIKKTITYPAKYWQDLTNILNSNGPPKNDDQFWINFWIDTKTAVMAKCSRGENLSKTEAEIAKIIGTTVKVKESAVEGPSNGISPSRKRRRSFLSISSDDEIVTSNQPKNHINFQAIIQDQNEPIMKELHEILQILRQNYKLKRRKIELMELSVNEQRKSNRLKQLQLDLSNKRKEIEGPRRNFQRNN